VGRPCSYTPAKLEAIANRLKKGEPLAAICRDEGMPDDDTVRAWMDREDVGEHVSQVIARAREQGEDAIAVQALEILDAPPVMTQTKYGEQVDSGDVALRKARFDGRIKLLSKWNPKRWGDKVDLNHSGKVGLESLIAGSE
jgi:transposase-like protein